MDTKNFDNIVKSMMESAQEEVSPRVWAGVQKGMQAAQARRTRIVFFKRAGFAIAAAAAAVALFIATGHLTDNSIQPNISNEAIALVPETPASSNATDSGREGLQNNVYAYVAETATAAVAKELATKELTAENLAQTLAEAFTEDTVQETVTELATETVMETAPAEPVAKEEFKDPFAAIMQEQEVAGKAKTSRHTRLQIGSNLGNNGVRTSPFSQPIRRSQQGSQYYNVIRENGESNYKMPVSFGLGVNFPLKGKLSIGTGLTYTSLSRTFPGKYLKYDESTGASELLYGDAKHTVKYIGIPVNLYYNFGDTGNFSFYAYSGAEAERSFLNKYRIALSNGKVRHRASNSGFQFSLGLGFGAEYRINQFIGLYIDPSIKYFFDCNQPKSIRTQHPWMFNVEAGLRFDL